MTRRTRPSRPEALRRRSPARAVRRDPGEACASPAPMATPRGKRLRCPQPGQTRGPRGSRSGHRTHCPWRRLRTPGGEPRPRSCLPSAPHDSGLGGGGSGHAPAVPAQAPPTRHVTPALSSSQTSPQTWPWPLADGRRVAIVTVGAGGGGGAERQEACLGCSTQFRGLPEAWETQGGLFCLFVLFCFLQASGWSRRLAGLLMAWGNRNSLFFLPHLNCNFLEICKNW